MWEAIIFLGVVVVLLAVFSNFFEALFLFLLAFVFRGKNE